MERICVPVETATKCSVEGKAPMLINYALPKKNPDHKVFVIKLPLDIDIQIQHQHPVVVLLIVLPWVCLSGLLLYLLSSLQHQFQFYEIELATLQIQSSQLSMQTFELQNQLTKMESMFRETRFDGNGFEGKKEESRRRKRDVNEGQNTAQREERDANQTSNEQMRGNVKNHRRLLKHSKKGITFGQIGPWYEDQEAVGDFGLRNCGLRDRGVKLIVNETGLYLIYAQVYYLATKSLNSYSINVFPGNKAMSVPVAFCSANASVNDQSASEVSCFTSIVRRLQAGDGISLQQQERNRRLVMRDGRTFIGVVRLS